MKKSVNRIVRCEAMENHQVWVEFVDGYSGTMDLTHLLEKKPFRDEWENYKSFTQVRIDPMTHTLTWGPKGKEIDIDPGYIRENLIPLDK